ncbi:MAG: TIGR02710 family CRISPR-associated protein [Lachnospiraceae bacterium]|jgi:CRISPR-associated protein (TIGR02710 family)|nr:TIGR02710 family CRISPR-associated protein [Lachnospiraceae bacterium]
MKKDLKKMTQEWMQLERKTLEQRKQADEFYENKLMKLIEEEFVKKNKKKIFEKAEYFVISVGTSYEPIVLNIRIFSPKRILFLYTDLTEKVLNKIVQYCALEPDVYEKSRVSETDPLDIYREIKRYYLEWKKPEKMYIDFTGGTKAMSAAAAMAGALINIQLVYVGTNDYLADFRKPNPGSETLFYINNPLAVFGDLEIEKAFALFEKYNYAGAKEKLAVLKESIPDPNTRQQLNFVYLLAETYEAWDALDFVPAHNNIVILNCQLRRDRKIHQNFLIMDFCAELERQEEILGYLKEIPTLVRERKNMVILRNKELITALMFTMCQNGTIREEQEKYDMATLLFYRLLEMIEQRRLAVYNLYASKMEYKEIKYNIKNAPEFEDLSSNEQYELLKEKVQDIKKQLFGKSSNYLPEQVSLLEGFIILLALGDPIVSDQEGHGIDKLKRIRSMVFLRNNSIFAHGLGPVGYRDFDKFRKFVLEMFEKFCVIEKIDYEKYRRSIEWVNPLHSRYYAPGMGDE